MPFGGGHVDADRRERVDDEVAAARVDRAHLADGVVAVVERGDRRQLHRLEHARVDVRLQPPVGLDRLGVADDRGRPPAGHVVALGQREDLDADLLGARRLEEARRDVAVERRLRVGGVVHDQHVVRAAELDRLARTARPARSRPSGCSGSSGT